MASNMLSCCARQMSPTQMGNSCAQSTILNPHIIKIYKALARSSRHRMTLLPPSRPAIEWPKSLELNAPLKSSGKTVNIWIGFWAGHGRGIIESDSQRPSLMFRLSPLCFPLSLSAMLSLWHSLSLSPNGFMCFSKFTPRNRDEWGTANRATSRSKGPKRDRQRQPKNEKEYGSTQ